VLWHDASAKKGAQAIVELLFATRSARVRGSEVEAPLQQT
jgi:hypothetical protein